MQTGRVAWLGDIRISSLAQELDDPQGERQRMPGQTIEDDRTYDVPGDYFDSGSLMGYVPQSNKLARLNTYAGNSASPILWSHGDGTTLGDIFRVSRVYVQSLGYTFPNRSMFSMDFSVVEPRHHAQGALRFYNTAVTGAVNGTGFELSGGVPTGYKLIINVHPWSQSGGASTVVHKFESDSANTFIVTPEDHALTNMTDALGGGTGGDAEQLVITGPHTDTWWRYVVTSVTAGTWSIAVTAALVTA